MNELAQLREFMDKTVRFLDELDLAGGYFLPPEIGIMEGELRNLYVEIENSKSEKSYDV